MIPLPPLFDDSPPNDSQFTDSLHTQAAVLRPGTQSLYTAALANLAPLYTASFTSGSGHWAGGGGAAAGLSEKAGSGGGELVYWADTITAAPMAFSATVGGGGGNSPALLSSSTTPMPSPATPTQMVPISPNPDEDYGALPSPENKATATLAAPWWSVRES
ncbi:hypothetical protein P167DRAFT_580361 [Morchella conica CCBAS932]|uniref:Uncharacterized protein n=1 Tax=Morchella conica CCBAS932 TaxID=1392247 RepID=A0A3N4KDS8_9PEZI|nr:hypothetical protein P167DRAFT_580361 [Morchella conica CCBAS932]